SPAVLPSSRACLLCCVSLWCFADRAASRRHDDDCCKRWWRNAALAQGDDPRMPIANRTGNRCERLGHQTLGSYGNRRSARHVFQELLRAEQKTVVAVL